MVERKGIVSAYSFVQEGGALYSILGDELLQLNSILDLELYDNVVMKDGATASHGKASEQEYNALVDKHVNALHIDDNAKGIDLKDASYGAQAKAILPRLAEAAKVLARAIVTGAPIVVRFHNDGDGASGAIALYRAFACLQAKLGIGDAAIAWRMNRRIAYGAEELARDSMFFSSWKSVERPVLFVTDLGTSPESVHAFEEMNKIATVIILDHHPPYADFPRNVASIYLNSWDFGADSDFTAGLLSCLLSELLCRIDVEDLKEASFVCDYSVYARNDDNAKKNGLVLDFMTASKTTNAKPSSMNAVLMDKEKLNEVFMRARSMQEEAMTEALDKIKSYKSRTGINVHVLDYGHIAMLSLDFPPLGRLTSILQRQMEGRNNLNTITIVYALSNISIRVSKDVADKVKLLEVIARIKKSADYEISGGGHIKAAGMSTNSSHMKEMVGSLLLELGVGGH